MYLTKKHQSPLWPDDPLLQARVLQWLMFQMGGVGPMFGQLHHFRRYAAHESYSLGRYEKEVHRLYAVLDKELGERPYRSEEHTSELQSLMRISYAVFCLKNKTKHKQTTTNRP